MQRSRVGSCLRPLIVDFVHWPFCSSADLLSLIRASRSKAQTVPRAWQIMSGPCCIISWSPEILERYAGDKLKDSLKGHGSWTLEIIKRSDTAKGFVLLPRRWVVERKFAWLGRCRRLAKDWEQSIESSTAWATIASIRMLTRRIASLSTH